MGKLDGKVAVLTGATYGLALASAKAFAQEGAFVFITGRDKEKLDNALAELGENSAGIQADSAKLDDLDLVFEKVKELKDHIDILFVSSGTAIASPLGMIKEEDVKATLDLNFTGTLFTVQKALPLIREGGSIILVGSIAASKGYPGGSVYAASKAAIRSFTRTWAAELVAKNIRVNTLTPGPIDTAAFEKAPKEMKEMFESMNPMKRIGRPTEIAATALFLASQDSSFITGSEIAVDGGMSQL